MSTRRERIEGYIEENVSWMEECLDRTAIYFNNGIGSVADITLDSFGNAMVRAIDWTWELADE